MDKIRLSRDHHVSDYFRKKSLFFRDTRDNQEHDAKKRLPIPGPSSEKPLAEIHRLKKTDLTIKNLKISPRPLEYPSHKIF